MVDISQAGKSLSKKESKRVMLLDVNNNAQKQSQSQAGIYIETNEY